MKTKMEQGRKKEKNNKDECSKFIIGKAMIILAVKFLKLCFDLILVMST